MEYRCETSTVTIKDIYDMYTEGTLIKPRIQRPKRWVDKDTEQRGKTNSLDFIKFIIKTGNIVNPLLLVEKIVNGTKSLLVIDGNNRLNAILLFINKPLYFFSDYIPESFPAVFKEHFIQQSLSEILKYRNFKSYCKNNNMIEEYNHTVSPDKDLDADFDDMCDKLHAIRFFDIKVPITRFENITSDGIKEIYEGVNKGGIKLTKQEILASTTSVFKYYPHQLSRYRDLATKVQQYYDDMNNNEVLKVQAHEGESLNMFEVLLGFQMILSEQYKFMQQPGLKELDVVFKCYEIIYDTFEDYNNDIDKFLQEFQSFTDCLHNIQNNFYNKHIRYSSIEKSCLRLIGNVTFILMIILHKNRDVMNDKDFVSHLRKILLYNELCSMVDDTKTKRKYNSSEKNILQYHAGGGRITRVCKNIIKNNINFEAIPSKEDILELMDIVNNENIKAFQSQNKNPRRLKVSKFKLLILSMYFNQKVPFEMLSAPKDIDHIIPFSIEKYSGELDIERLGNLILIDSEVNKKKGNKHITDDFIMDNHLQYMNYPTNQEVISILSHDRKEIIDTYKYNIMCERRERQYFKIIVDKL
jgi:hypothetical protein